MWGLLRLRTGLNSPRGWSLLRPPFRENRRGCSLSFKATEEEAVTCHKKTWPCHREPGPYYTLRVYQSCWDLWALYVTYTTRNHGRQLRDSDTHRPSLPR